MELTPETQDLIEQYINGSLTDNELFAFETRLKLNQDLADEVAFQKEMHAFLQDAPINELRKNLQTLSEQYQEKKEDRKAWFWWLGSGSTPSQSLILDWFFASPQKILIWLLPLLLLVGWWLFNKNTTPNKLVPPIVNKDSIKMEKLNFPIDTVSMPEPFVQDTPLPTDTNQAPNIVKKRPKKKKKPAQQKPSTSMPDKQEEEIYYEERLIRTADYIPPTFDNPSPPQSKTYIVTIPPKVYWYNSEVTPIVDSFNLGLYFGASTRLDSLITQNFSNDKKHKISVIQKPEIAHLTEDTTLNSKTEQNLTLALNIHSPYDLRNVELVLKMRDNQGNIYGPFSLEQAIKLQDSSYYLLNTDLKLWNRTPRLVYYSIEDFQTGQSFFTEKLAVIPKDSLLYRTLFPTNGIIETINIASPVFSQEKPDFFKTNPFLDSLITLNHRDTSFKISFDAPLPDTIYNTTRDTISKIQVKLQSKDDLLNGKLTILTTNNFNRHLDVPFYQEYFNYQVVKKYGSNTYFFPLSTGGSLSEEGLYYFRIMGGPSYKTFYTGKFIYLKNKPE
jgi:hypothetical protein